MQVEPAGPRFTAEQTHEGLEIVVPARGHVVAMLFMAVWLCGWGYGEMSVIRILLASDSKAPAGFLMVWLTGWTLGGGFAIYSLLWQLTGREVIRVTPGSLDHRHVLLGLGRTRSYRLSEVKNLRVGPVEAPRSRNSRVPGPVSFDYGARTLHLGAGLDEAEAHLLVKRLAPLLPKPLGAL